MLLRRLSFILKKEVYYILIGGMDDGKYDDDEHDDEYVHGRNDV